MKLFSAKEFFPYIMIAKMGVKMNSSIITKNHAADPEIGFLIKTISKPYGRATAMPTTWELNLTFESLAESTNLINRNLAANFNKVKILRVVI